MIEVAKEKKIEDISKIKKKEKQGYFGGWFGGSSKKEKVEE